MSYVAQPDATMTQNAPQSGTGWYVRGYREGDEASLLLLYEASFGRTRDAEHLRWKLLTRNEWSGQMVWLAVEQGSERVVGHYAGIPLEITIGGRQLKGIHSVEAMADPSYRRQGILTTLGTRAHQEWATAGYEIVIGLPNDKWGTRNAALGYVQLFRLCWLKYPLRLDRLAARRITGRVARRIVGFLARTLSDIWRMVHFGSGGPSEQVQTAPVVLPGQIAEAEALWLSISKLYPNAVVRSPEWLRWRYGEEPSGTFNLVSCSVAGTTTGLAAYRIIEDSTRRTGYLADLIVAPDDTLSARALLAAVLADLDKAGAGSVMGAAAPGSFVYRHLIRSGFRSLSAGFTFEIVPLSPGLDGSALKHPAEWHLSAGDFDIV